ncbi:hypothetical protein C1645_822162 [Glomus cerebriforme]|uniref:Uncharacterized protein n=1 Tax=Glomus cerebriforme TaxID=658196 RepID=A0A397T392_9GLOM|nr:hypothetical protein C1645_822162 [Glomus cerebriforme]
MVFWWETMINRIFSPTGDSNDYTRFIYINRFNCTVYSFDIKTQTWSTPSMTGMIPSRHRELQPVSDQNGKIYDGSDMSQTIQIFATMNILDSVSYIWITESQLNSPLLELIILPLYYLMEI